MRSPRLTPSDWTAERDRAERLSVAAAALLGCDAGANSLALRLVETAPQAALEGPGEDAMPRQGVGGGP